MNIKVESAKRELDVKIVNQTRTDTQYTPDRRYKIVFSDIGEYGMAKFVGSVKILENRNDNLLFNSKDFNVFFEYQYDRSAYCATHSNLFLFLKPCVKTDRTRAEVPYVVLDIDNKRFSLLNYPNYDFIEIDNRKFKLETHFRYGYEDNRKQEIAKHHGQVIDLDTIEWRDFDELSRVCQILDSNFENY
jgi:hypothetical protein